MNNPSKTKKRFSRQVNKKPNDNENTGLAIEQSDKKQKLIVLQSELAIKLNAVKTLNEAFGEILNTAFQISGIDCGGFYILDKKLNHLRLIYHKGLPNKFIKNASYYTADDPQFKMTQSSKPIYGSFSKISPNKNDEIQKEKLKAIAVIPIKHENSLIAVMNLASHKVENIGKFERFALEAIAAQVGGIIRLLSAEENLRKEQKNFQSLFDTLQDFLFVLDNEGQIIHTNPIVQNRLGYSSEELNHMHVTQIHPPEQRNEAANIISNMLKGKEKYCSIPLLKKNGTLIPVESRVNKGFWNGEEVLFGVSRDITEQVKARQILESEHSFRASILEYASEGLCVCHAVDHFPYVEFTVWNKRMTEICGYTMKEINKKGWYQTVYPDPGIQKRAQERMANMRLGDNLIAEEWEITCADGLERIVSISSSIIKSEDGKVHVLALMNDVTERKKSENELKIFNENLEELVNDRTQELKKTIKLLLDEIKERKRIEQELQTSKTQMQHVLNQMPVVLFAIDNKGIFTLSEGKGLQTLGLKPGEVVGQSVFEVYKDIPNILNKVNKALQGKITRAIQNVNEIVFDVLYTPLRDNRNRMNGVIGVAVDITEQTKANEALRFSEQKFSTAFHISPDMISISRISDSVILDVNESAKALLGYTPKEIIGKAALGLGIWPFPEERMHLAGHLSKNGFFRNEEIHMRKKDGTIINVLVSGSLIEIQNQKCVLSSLRDISERKKAEELLKESEERYRSLVDISPDGITLVDLERRFIMINPQTVKLHGYKNEKEILEIDPLKLVAPEDHEKSIKYVKRLFETGVSTSFELQLLRKDGSRFPAEVNATLLKNNDGNPIAYISIVRDISLRKKLEEEAFKIEKLESIGVLAGGIAHDFNNLLTAILGNISFAKMDISSSDKIHNRLSEAEKASYRAKDLTQQLLTFSKGGMPIKKKIVISELLKSACKFALSGSNVKSKFSFASNLLEIEADEGQINQVINNIVINALQAMPKGGLLSISAKNYKQKLESTVPLKRGDYIKIKISDQGIGIPKKHLSQIFDPYFTTKEMGHGLGLATVYSIINKHEGYITVKSELGKGTTFYIYIPASNKIEIKRQKAKSQENKNAGKVLVMDDEEFILEISQALLASLGYEIYCAKNGEEAIELYEKSFKNNKKFDLVIMDLTIPGGMGGKETIWELRKIDKDVKAIVSSGYANDPVMSNFQNYGFNDVITKPYRIQDLEIFR